MAQHVVTRTQRRIERKQLVLIVILILVVAGGSFALGVMYGGKKNALTGGEYSTTKPKIPMVTQITPPPPPEAEKPAEQEEKLTFYDNLPKGKQAPLGSGINLPPVQKQPAPKPGKTPEQVNIKPSSVPEAAPVATVGSFVVQIASFRTSEDAAKLVDRLKKYSLKAFVEEVDLEDKGVWYRVLVGPYDGRENADKAAGLLREKERFSALVRKR